MSPDGWQTTEWGEIVDGLAMRYGWTYAQVGEMTLTQVNIALNEGKPPEPGTSYQTMKEYRNAYGK